MNSNFRNFAIWVFIGLLLVALFNLFQSPGVHVRGNEISFSQLLSEVEAGNIQDVTIAGNTITGHFTDGRNFQTYAPNDPNLVDRLNEKGVKITAKPSEDDVPSLLGVLVSWFPDAAADRACGSSSCARCSRAADAPWASASPRRSC